MKTNVLKKITLAALLVSALSYSQNWQPETIVHNKETGLFLPFHVMDSISYKLIERNTLLGKCRNYEELFKTLKTKEESLALNLLNVSKTSLKWQLLYQKESEKSLLLSENFIDQKQITVNTKRKARRNGLYLFGGGIAVGVSIFALLAN